MTTRNSTVAQVAEIIRQRNPIKPGICRICGDKLADGWDAPSGFTVTVCDRCGPLVDKAYLLTQKQKKMTGWEIECPELFRDEIDHKVMIDTPYKYPTIDSTAYRKVQEWKYSPNGLTLIGDTGTGKSTSIWHALRCFDLKGVSWRAFTGKSLSVQWIQAINRKSEAEFLSKLKRTGILVFDDFGKEHLTAAMESLIFDLINARTEARLPVWITTRFTLAGVEAAYRLENRFFDQIKGQDIARRLRDYSETIVFEIKIER